MNNKKETLDSILKHYNYDIDKIDFDLRARLEELNIKSKSTEFIPPKGVKPLISAKNIKKTYKIGWQTIDAIKDMSLDIYPGEFVAITGTSGSGKSTLLHLIGGLDKATSGDIIIDNQKISKLNDSKLSNFRNKTIGFVFQFFYLQPFLTLAQNIAVPSMTSSMKKKDRDKRTEELAKAVGLENRLKHLPKELSGGQMQRVAIARALFNKPKILIADEPTGNLDSKNSQAIIDLFKKVQKDFNTTIIVVTHDRELAAQADRQIVVKDGEIL